MGETGYSLADIGALMGNKSDGFLEGNGIIILILFFLIFGFGGGAWGSTGQNQITNDFLYTNLASSIRDLGVLTNTGFQQATNQNFAIQQDIANQTNQVNQNLCSGFNSVNANITDIGYKMDNCCCELKTAIHAEGEATRALITENTIQQLRTDLQAAQLTLGNANQTQNILNALGSYKPYGYYGCGCGCSQFA